jgi:hypothetical protein
MQRCGSATGDYASAANCPSTESEFAGVREVIGCAVLAALSAFRPRNPAREPDTSLRVRRPSTDRLIAAAKPLLHFRARDLLSKTHAALDDLA